MVTTKNGTGIAKIALIGLAVLLLDRRRGIARDGHRSLATRRSRIR